MHRAKSSVHLIFSSTSNSSGINRQDSTLEFVPYDAKLKSSGHGRIMPWLQPHVVIRRLISLLQLLLLAAAVGLWLLHAQARWRAAQPQHLVVLDAGSTGTRVHVFQYAADASSSYASLHLPEPKLKVQPGLSAFADDAAGAAASLQPLLQFAAQHIPASQIPQTPVYLMATAGLRLLPAAAADSILSECRSALLASNFLFQSDWAQIISGTYEGLYAWVAANYAAGHLQAAAEDAAHSRKDLHAVQPGHAGFKALLEMGGASAQVTFMPEPSWHKHSTGSSKQRVRLKLPGVNHPLWSHSYLGYGFDVVQSKVHTLVKQLALTPSDAPLQAAQLTAAVAAGHNSAQATAAATAGGQAAAVPSSSASDPQHPQASAAAVHVGEDGVVDPCLPAGFHSDDGRVGSGVWQQCQQLVEAVIDPASCRPVKETPCPELPDNMPQLTGDLLAIENFAYTAHALSLPAVASLGDFATAARQFCSRPWPQTLQAHSQEPEQQQYLWRYCFGSAFAWTLLHQVLRISEGQQLHFTNMLVREDGAELGLDWALGAAVLQLANNSAAEGARLDQQRHSQQLLLFAAVAVTALSAVLSAATVQAAWRSGGRLLAQQPNWLTVVMSNGVGTSGSGSKASTGAGSWSSMAGSAWANAVSRGSVKPGYAQQIG